MGLDYVEVIMEIEDTFEIANFDVPVAPVPFDMLTADDLCEHVWQRLQGREPAWTEADFNRIVTLTAPLRQRTEAYLRGLPRPLWQWSLPRQMNRLVKVEALANLWKELELIWGFPPPPLVPNPRGDSVELPASCRTRWGLLGTLIRQWTLQHEPRRFVWQASSAARPTNADQWTRAAVWDRLQSILMKSLHLPQEVVQQHATLKGDLRMD